MSPAYTAVVKQDGQWWIGWIEEVPGVNCQERTRDELLESLRIPSNHPWGSAGDEREISDHLARNICKDLGVPQP